MSFGNSSILQQFILKGQYPFYLIILNSYIVQLRIYSCLLNWKEESSSLPFSIAFLYYFYAFQKDYRVSASPDNFGFSSSVHRIFASVPVYSCSIEVKKGLHFFPNERENSVPTRNEMRRRFLSGSQLKVKSVILARRILWLQSRQKIRQLKKACTSKGVWGYQINK